MVSIMTNFNNSKVSCSNLHSRKTCIQNSDRIILNARTTFEHKAIGDNEKIIIVVHDTFMQSRI